MREKGVQRANAILNVLVRVLAWQGSWVLVLFVGGCLRSRSSVSGWFRWVVRTICISDTPLSKEDLSVEPLRVRSVKPPSRTPAPGCGVDDPT